MQNQLSRIHKNVSKFYDGQEQHEAKPRFVLIKNWNTRLILVLQNHPIKTTVYNVYWIQFFDWLLFNYEEKTDIRNLHDTKVAC
jgi:hypothetical protein